MRRLALGLLLLAACHSRKTEEATLARPAPSAAAEPPPPPTVPLGRTQTRESSGLVLARIEDAVHALLADEDDQAIVEIDPESKAIVQSTKLDSRPRDLLVLADGRLAVTLPDAGAVVVLTRDARGGLHEAMRVKTPAEPLAMAVDARDTELHVTTGASHSLVTYDDRLAEKRRVSLGREPRAALSHGDRVFVTHAIEDFVSVVAADGSVTTTDVNNLSTCGVGSHCTSARNARHAQAIVRHGENGIIVPTAQVLPVPSPAFSKRALCPPSVRFINGQFVPIEKPKKPEGGGYGFGDEENGPPVTSDLEVLDGRTGKKWAAGNPPNLGAECILPRAAASDQKSVLVACMGSSRVMRYGVSPNQQVRWDSDPLTLDPKGRPPYPSYPNGVVPNLTATKIDVPAGPTALAMGEKGEAFVWSSLSRQLSRIRADKAESLVGVPRTIPVAREWLAGRELFFTNGDKRISKDGRACANCHIDGADDGLAWKTPDGMRRTRLLRGELAKGPYGWMGEHETLKDHVEITLKNLKGTGLPEDDTANLVAYVAKLNAPKPRPEGDVERGKQVFASAECSKCHAAGRSDRQLHDVGTGGTFMTPTLAAASTRRVLMHDGRFKSLDEALKGTPNMGRGAELGDDDRKALAAYLETL